MLQQDASKTRLYRGLVLDRPTHALVRLTVSRLGCTKLIFIKPRAKISGQYYRALVRVTVLWRVRNCQCYYYYYRDVWLMQKLLAAICSIAGDVFVFQQSSRTMRQHIVLVT